MKLVIEVNMDNDAFKDSPEKELDRILQEVGNSIYWNGDVLGNCFDINGNRVGHWEIEPD
jgi:hypothetical protein